MPTVLEQSSHDALPGLACAHERQIAHASTHRVHTMHATDKTPLDDANRTALRFILEAWEEAMDEGIDGELLANASLFAALTDLVSTYGEEAVITMTQGLPSRIQQGEFTLNRTMQ